MENFDGNGYFWQGERVRLRAHRPEDWEQKYQEFLDSNNRRILEYGLDLPETPEQYRRYYQGDNDVREGNRLSFAIETLEGEFVGWVNVFLGDPRHGVFSCGMGIFHAFRKQGYGEEAMRLVLRYCFQELRYQRCSAECLASNTASIKLQERLGFVREGLRRRVLFTNGQYHDEYVAGLLCEEFEANDAKVVR